MATKETISLVSLAIELIQKGEEDKALQVFQHAYNVTEESINEKEKPIKVCSLSDTKH